MQKNAFLSDCNGLQLGDDVTIKTSDWLKGKTTFAWWRAEVEFRKEVLTQQNEEETRRQKLAEKYARIWRMKTVRGEYRAHFYILYVALSFFDYEKKSHLTMIMLFCIEKWTFC